MSTVDELIKQQEETGDEITRLITNYKKASAERKTKAYLEQNLENAQALYDQFYEVDNQIRATPGIDQTNPYFKQRNQISRSYDALVDSINRLLPTRQASGSTTVDITPRRSTQDDIEANKEDRPPPLSLKKAGDFSGKPEVKQQHIPGGDNIEGISVESRRLLKRVNIKISVINNLLRQARSCLDENRATAHLSQKMQQLENNRVMLDQLYEDILLEIPEEHQAADFVQQQYEITSINVDEMKIEISEAIQQQAEQKSSASTSNFQPKLKLPSIEIPYFDGQYKGWATFHDRFSRFVHDNSNLTETHKISYLKSYVRGDAAKLIKHITTTGTNYSDAWKILVTRYNNKRLLVTNHVNTLLNQSNIMSESANAIKSIHDTITENLYAINNLGINTESWNAILIPVILRKLDNETCRLYEVSLKNPREIQPLNEFLSFLEGRFQSLEASNIAKGTQQHRAAPTIRSTSQPITSQPPRRTYAGVRTLCIVCKGSHEITNCPTFIKMPVLERSKLIASNNLCRICLISTHNKSPCKSNEICVVCKGKHNTLLHTREVSTSLHAAKNKKRSENNGVPLLATAQITATTRIGYASTLRALIDPGSQSSFITNSAAEQLNLPKFRVDLQVSGIGGMRTSNIKYKVYVTVAPRYSSKFKQVVEAFILPKLTERLPSEPIRGDNNNPWKELVLADPEYNIPASVDMILGADVYANILLDGVIKSTPSQPVAQNTELGWILLGVTEQSKIKPNSVSLIVQNNLDIELRKFWEIEEIINSKPYSEDEELCEQIYKETYNRLPDGRYEVTIPTKDDSNLGNSRKRAIARLLQVEKRLGKDSQLRLEYHNFMNEYIKLGHMVPIKPLENETNVCYLPHHAVVKQSSTTTKLRVVFDASMKTTNGLSFNDIQLVGPKLQEDLFSIISRWRKHKYVFIADIEKMYRQILVTQKQQDFQRVLWRTHPQEQMMEYKLRTVTYGTSSAPYLAIRTLRQLAMDEQKTYPIASEILLRDFYVDDVLSGADTIEYAQECQQQLREMLNSGGFKLRKWASNNKSVIVGIPEEHRETKPNIMNKHHEAIKTLGIMWNPQKDEFEVQVNMEPMTVLPTKRSVISEIAKIFDPLGWFSPTIIIGKIMFQQSWVKGLSWDEELPEDMKKKWINYKGTFKALEKIKIPRWLNTEDKNENFELHGFCDASELAYAAVVYCKVITAGKATITLVSGKTKVAPVSKKLSLPRLELCGAVLLAKLLRQVSEAIDIPTVEMHAWTDSTIVLAWLQGHPSKWKTFVANRISQIHSILSPGQWKHVISKENPADCATRGIDPDKLIDHKLWWSGPEWLISGTNSTSNHIIEETDLECKQQSFICTLDKTLTISNIIEKFSSLTRMIRVVAYCRRFYWNINPKNNKRTSSLTVQELQEAKIKIVKISQAAAFEDDIRSLKERGSVNSKSKNLCLYPFLDKHGVLRVGGRLQHSSMQYNQKHPIILPYKSHLTNLILDWGHKTTHHGGVNLSLAFIRNQFWIIHGKRATKQHIHRCLKCFRFNTGRTTQLMGSLPTPRVTPSRPFTHTGVDYAGPIDFRMSKGRGSKSQKGYIAVFICLTTKAMHIELVSDLTTQGFLAAFKRFIARRGHVTNVYSDNATNFVAANKYLQGVYQHSTDISNMLSNQGIQWHFIPPRSPHFGGLWEAGVKLIKQHMKKTVSSSLLTFEELTTLLCQIEASLNSRPLCPLSDDANELECLTPGHFLTGELMLALPEGEPLHLNPNLLTRWQLIERMHGDFWKMWSKNYLLNMQQRVKWRKQQPNIKQNQLVIIRDEQTPPTKWKMGKVIEIHPGRDQLTRVVTLKTQNGIIKRSISKVCPLPTNSTSDQDDKPIPGNSETPPPVDQDEPRCVPSPKVPGPTQRITRSQSAKLAANVVLYSVCLVCLFCNVTVADEGNKIGINIEYLSHQPGLYFEKEAEMNPLASTWNIILYYDLRDFDAELINMNIQYKYLKQFCYEDTGHKHNSDACVAFIQHFEHHMENIKKATTIIQNSNKERNRFKRGLGDTVGHVMGDLFGVLNERDAQRYEELIANLEDRSETLIDLTRNQTSIINATVNVMKHNSELTRKHLTALNNHISLLGDRVNNLTADNAYLHRIQMINMLSIQLMLISKNVEDTQKIIIEVLTHAHNGIISSQLISPTQLEEALGKIKDHIPAGVTLPSYYLTEIYEMITVKARVSTNLIIFNIQIPLIQSNGYNIYRVIPVPFNQQGQQYIISPSTPLLAVTNDREYYSPMTDTDLKQCVTINSDHLTCHIAPIYNTRSEVSICEMNMLQHNEELHHSCNIKRFNSTNYWAKVNDRNKWIFSIKNEKVFDLICDKTVTAITLKGSGILYMKHGCSLKDKSFHIPAPFTINSKLKSAFIPTINVSIAEQTMHYSSLNITRIPIARIDTDQLEELIEEQHGNINWKANPNRHDVHHYSLSYINLAGLVLIILVCMLWLKKQRNQQPAPLPAPRRVQGIIGREEFV